MDTLDFAMNFEANEQSEADKKLLVIFYKGTIKNEFKSTEAGRPIFDEIDLVKILTPGSRDTFTGDATETYQARFPQQWARYKAGQSQELAGTPLNMLPWLSIGQIAEFEAVNVKTVEHLAGMPDVLAQKFMGAAQIKSRAQQYLDAAHDAAPLLKVTAELNKRDVQIEELKATVQALKDKIDADAAKKVK
jgi:hypothetical protein